MSEAIGTALTWIGCAAALSAFGFFVAGFWLDDWRFLATGCCALVGGGLAACIGMTINA